VPEPRRFKLPILCTIELPTASTAPMGFIRLGPLAISFSTLNKRIPVPFQTPTVPRSTTISDVQIKDQSNDSYQPMLSGVHSKVWIRGRDGSIVAGSDWRGVDPSERDMSVRIECSGRVGSQVSIHSGEGENTPPIDMALWLATLVILFVRENWG
jgi:hypothetical protein